MGGMFHHPAAPGASSVWHPDHAPDPGHVTDGGHAVDHAAKAGVRAGGQAELSVIHGLMGASNLADRSLSDASPTYRKLEKGSRDETKQAGTAKGSAPE